MSVFAATGTANALTADGNPTPEWLIFLLPAIAALIEAVAQFIKARAQRPQAKTRAAR